jgi:hypothetical protein
MPRAQPKKAGREADAAECLLWSEQMEGFGGPAQPSPTIAQCLNGLSASSRPILPASQCKLTAPIPCQIRKRGKEDGLGGVKCQAHPYKRTCAP